MATRDRREYLSATTLDQGFLDRSQDSLVNGLHMVADVEAPDSSTIRISDRNKYVDGDYYTARTKFPLIKRTLGDWLSPEVQFSRLQIAISNVDGVYNHLLPGGPDFGGWIGKEINVRVGLRDVGSTYESIYQGFVTDIGGAQRDRKQIILITRDKFDKVNVNFPNSVFTKDSFPDIEESYVGTVVPVIYGDWTVNILSGFATVPAYPINGNNAGVLAGTTSVQCVVAPHPLAFFDTASVYLVRGETYYLFDAGDVSIVTENRVVDIKQGGNGGTTLVDGNPFTFTQGDIFRVKVKGKDLTGYDDNIIWQARDILMTYGGLVSGDFDANWATYRDKSTPAESALANFKSRVWIQQQEPVIRYVLSMLEQVRVEAFVSKDLMFKLTSLHFDEFQAAPSFTIRNWDLATDTFNPQLDDKNIWNRARAEYALDPTLNQQAFETPIFKNTAAITQAGKEISKKVVFPNLYEEATVILQLKEMIKLASGYPEIIELTLTPRALKQELGQFVKINVQMGSAIFENVPAMVREIGYDPDGIKLPMKLWSMQMTPFPGYSPGYAGIVGGSSATIDQES